MAVLYLLFWVIKVVGKLSALSLYVIAITFQTIGLLGFAISLCSNNENAVAVGITGNSFQNNVSGFVSLLYSLVTIFFLIKLLLNLKKLNAVALSTTHISKPIQQHVQNVLQAYLPHKNVMVKWVQNVTTIFTYGFFKPVIVLPIACINNLTEDELTAIILHEIAHVKYAHFIINIWVEVVSAVLWFNPFNYWLHKEINFYREASADAFVLKQTENKFSYANGLYKLAVQAVNKQPIALPAVNTQNELLQRIQLFTQQKLPIKISQKPITITLLAFAILFGINKIAQQTSPIVLQKTVPIVAIQQKNAEQKLLLQNTKEKVVERKIAKKTKTIAKKVKQEKPSSIYLLQDKQAFAKGLKFLSELAIANPTVQNILVQNPTIQPVALKEEDNKQSVRRFIISPTATKGAVLVKIIVEEKPNKKPKVTIELEELPLVEGS